MTTYRVFSVEQTMPETRVLTPHEMTFVRAMTDAAIVGKSDGALRLIAQLHDMEPCEACDVIKRSCVCHERGAD
jgi:hypothetical protein